MTKTIKTGKRQPTDLALQRADSIEMKSLRRTPLYFTVLSEAGGSLRDRKELEQAPTTTITPSILPEADNLKSFIENVLYGDVERVKNYLEELESDDLEQAQKLFFHEFDVLDSERKKIKGCVYEFAYWMRNDAMCDLLEQYMTVETKIQMQKKLVDHDPKMENFILGSLHAKDINEIETDIKKRVVQDDEDIARRAKLALRYGLIGSLVSSSVTCLTFVGLVFLFGSPLLFYSSLFAFLAVFIPIIVGVTVGCLLGTYQKLKGLPIEVELAQDHEAYTPTIIHDFGLEKHYQFLIQSPILRIADRINREDVVQFIFRTLTNNTSIHTIDLRAKNFNDYTFFRTGLFRQNCSSVRTLDLSDNQDTGDWVIGALSHSIVNPTGFPSLSNLFLNNTGVTKKSIANIVKMLKSKPTLTTLSLRNNNLDCACILELMDGFRNDKNELLVLNLGGNAIKNAGVGAIANWLATNPKLKTLDLSCNPFNDEGAAALLQAIETNSHLECLHLPDTISSDLQDRINEKLKVNIAENFNPDSRSPSCH